MIDLGDLYQLVHHHSGMAVTYSDVYLTKGNPYMLKRISAIIGIANADGTCSRRILAIGSLSSTQGGERFNAFHKIQYPLITSGRPGAALSYIRSLYIARAATASSQYAGIRPPLVTKNQRKRWPDEVSAEPSIPLSKGSIASRDRELKKREKTAKTVATCDCGRPCTKTSELTTLVSVVRQAESLRLVRGRQLCCTCHDVAQILSEMGNLEVTGKCAEMMEMADIARYKLNEQVAFDLYAEKVRVFAENADKAQATRDEVLREAEAREESEGDADAGDESDDESVSSEEDLDADDNQEGASI